MKKRLLLTVLMAALLVCLFAISINAAGSTSNEFAETPDTIEGINTPTVIGTEERVVLLGSDGLYYTFPSYYILNDNKSCSLKVNNAVNKALGYTDGTSHKSYVVRIEIPEGTTYINQNFLDYISDNLPSNFFCSLFLELSFTRFENILNLFYLFYFSFFNHFMPFY